MYQYIHAEVYARRASTNPKNKTKYCIDDIIGEVIRDPAHSEAIANPQPPRYIISSEAGLKGMLMKIKENAANLQDFAAWEQLNSRSQYSGAVVKGDSVYISTEDSVFVLRNKNLHFFLFSGK